MKEKTLILLLVFAFNIEGRAQTSNFGLLLGGEATKLEELNGVELNPTTPVFEDAGFRQLSFLVGGIFEQELAHSFSLLLKSSFGVKFVTNAYIGGIFMTDSFTYGHFYNSILLRKNIYNKIALGIGFGYDLFPKDRLDGKYRNEKVAIIDLSYSIKKYTLNAAYAFGTGKEFAIEATKPSKSIRLTLEYKFWSPNRKNKKVHCPTI